MANASTEIMNAGFALVDLAKKRDTAIRTYNDYKNSITDPHLTVTDGEYLAATYNAFTNRNELIKSVLEESETYFNMLEASLQFGLKELGKPLVLPASGPFNPAQVRCLVVTLKPIEAKNTASQHSTEPAYSYDVQLKDLR